MQVLMLKVKLRCPANRFYDLISSKTRWLQGIHKKEKYKWFAAKNRKHGQISTSVLERLKSHDSQVPAVISFR